METLTGIWQNYSLQARYIRENFKWREQAEQLVRLENEINEVVERIQLEVTILSCKK